MILNSKPKSPQQSDAVSYPVSNVTPSLARTINHVMQDKSNATINPTNPAWYENLTNGQSKSLLQPNGTSQLNQDQIDTINNDCKIDDVNITYHANTNNTGAKSTPNSKMKTNTQYQTNTQRMLSENNTSVPTITGVNKVQTTNNSTNNINEIHQGHTPQTNSKMHPITNQDNAASEQQSQINEITNTQTTHIQQINQRELNANGDSNMPKQQLTKGLLVGLMRRLTKATAGRLMPLGLNKSNHKVHDAALAAPQAILNVNDPLESHPTHYNIEFEKTTGEYSMFKLKTTTKHFITRWGETLSRTRDKIVAKRLRDKNPIAMTTPLAVVASGNPPSSVKQQNSAFVFELHREKKMNNRFKTNLASNVKMLRDYIVSRGRKIEGSLIHTSVK